MKKELNTDYGLIPTSEITDEARQIAVRWGANMKDDFIDQKQKLASDIQNYARRYHDKQMEKYKRILKLSDEEIEFVKSKK